MHPTKRQARPARRRRLRAAALAVLCLAALAGVASAAAPDPELSARRALRRAQVRLASRNAAKAADGGPQGLLVIPVDFADARLPADWTPDRDLARRLTGPAPSLHHYWRTASDGRLDLRITLAPLVRLPGTREDYSDLGTAGRYDRTRALARTALEAVRDTGLPLRLLDTDGPDGIAGSDDDDGMVDGVLILHAGPGLENGGLVVPLQYYLEEPVAADGVAASAYAVASLRSGLGIWAHESGHLLGLEERYDPLLPSYAGESEIHSRGGLGRFSVMAAGAWGTGGGDGCALPDAYSRSQLGWCDLVDLPRIPADSDTLRALAAGGHAARVWTHGLPGEEFFVLEVRDPGAAAPYDAAVPGGGVVAYHVDETVPDGGWTRVGTSWRLRAHVVEADGDDGLRAGDDEGGAADLFPGTTGVTAWTPSTVPSTAGWHGPSLVALTGIAPADDGVRFDVTAADGPAVLLALAFPGQGDVVAGDLVVTSVGTPLATPVATVTAGTPPLGSFFGTTTGVTVDLVASAPGVWVPAAPLTWHRDPDLAPGAATRFTVRVSDGAWSGDPVVLPWIWEADGGAFDFGASWPGAWRVEDLAGDGGTVWQRWTAADGPAADGRAVLACAAPVADPDASWPDDVRYGIRADAALTTPPVGPGTVALRLVHAWDTEVLPTGAGMDGGVLEWVDARGEVRPATPADGWPTALDAGASMPLHGRGGFAGPGERDGRRVVWRVDVVPLPAAGSGPWRLRLRFASNGQTNAGFGWLVAEVAPLAAAAPGAGLTLDWDGSRLAWACGLPGWTDPGAVQRREGGSFVATLPPGTVPDAAGGGWTLTADRLLPHLPAPARTRHVLRVRGDATVGPVASRPLALYADGGEGATPSLGLPWPNPFHDEVRFLLTVPAGGSARLRIFDVRGRLLREWSRPPGSHLLSWDGTGAGGGRAASGTYILHVEGAGGSRSHKVVFLH